MTQHGTGITYYCWYAFLGFGFLFFGLVLCFFGTFYPIYHNNTGKRLINNETPRLTEDETIMMAATSRELQRRKEEKKKGKYKYVTAQIQNTRKGKF